MSRRHPRPRVGGDGPATRGERADQAAENPGWTPGQGVRIILRCSGRPGLECRRVVGDAHFVRLLDADGAPAVRLHLGGKPWRGPACPKCNAQLAPLDPGLVVLARELIAAGKTRHEMYWQQAAQAL